MKRKENHIREYVKQVLRIMSFVFIFTAYDVAAAEAFQLPLKPVVTVDDSVVYVRDIISEDIFVGPEHIGTEKILAIAVTKAPRPGKHRQLSRSYIVMKLKNKNIDVTDLSFGGAKTVIVSRSHQTCTQERIKKEVAAFLCDVYKIDIAEAKIIIENLSREIFLPKGDLRIILEELASGFKNGKLNIRLTFFIDGELYREKIISVKVLRKRNVFVAERDIAVGEELTEKEVALKEFFVDERYSYCDTVSSVLGKQAKVKLRKGDFIKPQCLKKKILIEKKDMVMARFSQKSMRVRFKVRALEAGSFGDTIKIFSKETQKKFTGKIISANCVEVLL